MSQCARTGSPVDLIKLACLATAFAGSVAVAVIAAPSPNYAVRLTADFHIQLQVTDTILPDTFPGECRISGRVVRVFRDRTATLDEGQTIDIVTPCDATSAETGAPEISDADELAEAPFLELFLNPGVEAGYALAGHQYMVIKNATQDPLCETEKAGIMC